MAGVMEAQDYQPVAKLRGLALAPLGQAVVRTPWSWEEELMPVRQAVGRHSPAPEAVGMGRLRSTSLKIKGYTGTAIGTPSCVNWR